MNELLQELNSLAGEMKAHEQAARDHEQAARDASAKRQAAKQRQSELLALINDTKVVHAVQQSALAATAAQQVAEGAKAECVVLLDALRTKIAECDAKSAKFDELIKRFDGKQIVTSINVDANGKVVAQYG